jgi:hypothetical protein
MQKILTVLCLTLFASPAFAQHPITVIDPWIRASIGDAPNTAAYAQLHNTSNQDIRLTSVKWAAQSALSSQVYLHKSEKIDGQWSMTPQHHGILIPAGQTLALKPRDYHMMLIALSAQVIAGKHYRLELQFDNTEPLEVSFVSR